MSNDQKAISPKGEDPMEQGGFVVNEAPVVIFFEVIKDLGDSKYAVAHTTIRDISDENAQKRLDWHLAMYEAKGFKFQDAPKQQYQSRGGGGGQKRKDPAPVPDDGKFQVSAFAKFVHNSGNQIRVYGVNGEEVADWGGKTLDALLKTLDPKVSQPFLNWAAWAENEQHPLNWTTHKLFLQCEKSTKINTRTNQPYWNAKQFVIE